MKKTTYKRAAIRAALMVALALAAQCAVAANATLNASIQHLPQDPVLRRMTPVPNSVLADMRGRFVSTNQITYFGLTLISRLEGAAGSVTGQLSVQADLSGRTPIMGFTSNVDISSQANLSEGDDLSATAMIVKDRGASTKGRVFHGTFQTVQTAGGFNKGVNTLDVSIVDAQALNQSLRANATTGPAIADSDAVGLPTPKRIGINLQLNDSSVRQGISAGRGLRQAIRLHGNQLTGSNLADLRIGVSQVSAGVMTSGQASVVRSLRNLPR